MVPLVGLQSAILTFPGHTHFLVMLANIVFFSSKIKMHLLALIEPVVAGKSYLG